MKVLLKDGKFAGYEPRKKVIKKTMERKSGKTVEDKDLDKIFNRRMDEFKAMPEKNRRFTIIDKKEWRNETQQKTES